MITLIYSMEELLKQKEQLKILKNKYEKKIFLIENELINFEKEITKYNEDTIVNTLNLSDQQRQIVEAEDNNMLIIACPGAGKTHTLISRYIHLILKKNIKPETILLITFTKKAGQEMLHRLEDIVPTKLPFHVGSLHGLSYRILQKYNNINYTVLDEKEANELLKNEAKKYLKDQNIDEEIVNLIINKIVYIVNQVSSTYPINFKIILKKLNLIKYQSNITQIYKNFNKKKKLENTIDFNDLMIQFCDFLKSIKSVEFKLSINYVFFDEYQDINPIQNYILSLFKTNSKIMVVGDDAQSIYSFRGSSVKYIYNFPNEFIPNNKYFLVENYRSTPRIVNFCQNIIEKNLNQYDKKVTSNSTELGIMPSIHGFFSSDAQEEQYKWIIEDILNKNKLGISYSNMVILARTNRSLERIETYISHNKISYTKSIGTNLLDKYHIKDFLSFIIILNNKKSSIHWKRIIGLHKGFSIAKANEIVDNSSCILTKVIELSNTNEQMTILVSTLTQINNINKDIEKAKYILSYLEKLWLQKHKNIEEFRNDILNLLFYLRNCSLNEFINNLYLNQEVECNYDNILYLSTIHGAKGLEWDHVYIIDLNNNEFPNVQNCYYTDELDLMEEERRLFYVGCSRAKKYLTLTYDTDKKNGMSPFIREIDNNLFMGNNVIKHDLNLLNNIPKDVTTILKNIGYINVAKLFGNLNIKEKYIHSEFDISRNINSLKNKFIIGNFIDYLIPKILQNNFSNKNKKFNLNLIHKYDNFPKKIYHEYIDDNTHWTNLLENIFFCASFHVDSPYILLYKEFLLSSIAFYKELEQGLIKLVELLKPNIILNHYNVNFDLLKAEIDLLFDDILIEIKVTSYEICCVQYLCQVFLYGYLMVKKGKKINKIVLYNVENGTIHIIDTTNFDFELFYNSFYN